MASCGLKEMFTGKRPTEDMFSDGLSLHNLSKMAFPERVMEIVDSNLVGELDEDRMYHCLVSIARIGVACSEESASDRMDIKDVVIELNIIKCILGQESMGRDTSRCNQLGKDHLCRVTEQESY